MSEGSVSVFCGLALACALPCAVTPVRAGTVEMPGDREPVLCLELDRTATSGLFVNSYGRLPTSRVDLSATWRTNALIVTVRQFLADGKPARATGMPSRPISIFERGDATIEMFFEPGDGHEYQVSANPSNVVYVARDHFPWNGFARPVRTCAFQTDDHWGVTFTVPFGAFGEAAPVPGECRHYEFAAGSSRWRGGMALRYGTFVFGAVPPVATVEAASVDANGVMHMAYAVAPQNAAGEIPHKRQFRYDVRFAAAGAEPLALQYADDKGDRDWLALDRFYYSSSNDVRLFYSAKGFSRPRISVRNLIRDETVYAERRSAAGCLDLGRLPSGEYALCVTEDARHTSCQFEVVGGEETAKGDGVPYYPIVGSQDMTSRFHFKEALRKTFHRHEGGCHYRFDTRRPFFDATAITAEDVATTFFRLAYEAQIQVRLGEDPKTPAGPIPDNGEFYRERYRELKRRFPDRTFTIHVDGAAVPASYVDACDVFEFAFSYGACPLSTMRRGLDRRLACLKGKPFIVWLGASLPDNGRCRTPDELNTMVRYSILRGAAGNVFHLGHGGVPRADTRLWSYLRESERVTNIWYADWAHGQDVDIGGHADEDVHFGARKGPSGILLLVVNLSPLSRTLTYEDPATGVRRRLTLTGSGSAVCRIGK